MTSEFTNLWVNGIENETEKAYKLNIQVEWNGNSHNKSFWFPKSVVIAPSNTNETWKVKSWFSDKIEKENTFKGYRMRIDVGFAM